MGNDATAWEPVEESTKGWEPVDEPAEAKPDESNWLIGSHWAGNHPLTTSILKSFDIANIGKNVASGAVGTVKGAYELGKDVVNNPNWVTGPDSTYEKFVGAPAAAQAQQATQLWQQGGVGNRVEAAGHELAGMLPVVGPWAASLGTQAGTGDVGGAVGQGIGAGLGSKAMSKLPELPGKLNEVIPSTKRGGAGIGVLEKTYAEHPMPVDAPYTTAMAIRDELAKTASEKRVHKLIDGYRENIDARDAMRDPQKAAEIEADAVKRKKPSPRAALDKLADPSTFDGARAYLREANQLINKGELNQLHTEQLRRFAGSLSDSIDQGVAKPSNVAPAGFADDYQAMKNEVRRGHKVIRVGENIGPVVGGAIGAYFGRGAGALADVTATGVGAAAGRYLLKPVIGGMARSVMSREAGPPQLKSLEPPPIPRPPGSYNQTLAQYTRDMLAAKEGKISPTYLNQKIKKSPKLRPIPRPPDEE